MEKIYVIMLRAFIFIGAISNFIVRPAAEKDISANSDAAAVSASSAAVVGIDRIASVMSDEEKKALSKHLFEAVHDGDAREAEQLIAQGASVNMPETGGDLTPLMYAAKRPFVDLVALLIRAGADVNASERFTGTVLMKAGVLNPNMARYRGEEKAYGGN